jgi:hypothetical protein
MNRRILQDTGVSGQREEILVATRELLGKTSPKIPARRSTPQRGRLASVPRPAMDGAEEAVGGGFPIIGSHPDSLLAEILQRATPMPLAELTGPIRAGKPA